MPDLRTLGALATAGAGAPSARTDPDPSPSPRSRLFDRIAAGVSFVVAAAVCAVLVPEGHGFSGLAPVAAAIFLVSGRFYLRQRVGWFSCQQAAFVFLIFSVPLNFIPLAVFVCLLGDVAATGDRPLMRLLLAAGNSWWSVTPSVLLAVLAPGPASWHHWTAYVLAFGGQFMANHLIFVVRYRVTATPFLLPEQLTAVIVDACLTLVGLAVAVSQGPAPGGSLAAMIGLTVLLGGASHEQHQRWVQTERALRDPLTGLANRALFDETLTACESRCQRKQEHAALLLIDLDDFKPINDALGHQAGDEVLRAFADGLRDGVRAIDTPARLGGDEFAVILAEPVELGGAELVAEKLRKKLASPITLTTGEEVAIAFSIGSAVFGCGASAQDATAEADTKLYVNKRSRKAPNAPQARPAW